MTTNRDKSDTFDHESRRGKLCEKKVKNRQQRFNHLCLGHLLKVEGAMVVNMVALVAAVVVKKKPIEVRNQKKKKYTTIFTSVMKKSSLKMKRTEEKIPEAKEVKQKSVRWFEEDD